MGRNIDPLPLLLFSCQAHVPLLHLAHVCARHHRLRRHDVPNQRHLRLGQHRLHGGAAAAHPLPQSHLQLGLHQPGPHFPPGTTSQAHTDKHTLTHPQYCIVITRATKISAHRPPPLSSTRVWASAKQSFHQVYRAAHMRTHTHAHTNTGRWICAASSSAKPLHLADKQTLSLPPLSHTNTHTAASSLLLQLSIMFISVLPDAHTHSYFFFPCKKKTNSLHNIQHTCTRVHPNVRLHSFTWSHSECLASWLVPRRR